jgi:glycosyltransferase involved in cell wall biosynthesis
VNRPDGVPHTWHILTGEYPPQPGGVSDYSRLLARALAAEQCDVHVWCPGERDTASVEDGVAVHRLVDCYQPMRLAALGRRLDAFPAGGVLLVQYVPNAFGLRGLNAFFCLWALLRARRRGDDVRVMFHEPFFYFTAHRPWRNALAVVHRGMAALLLYASRRVYVSIPAWGDLLRPYQWGTPAPMEWLPIPSTIQQAPRLAPTNGPRHLTVGHFGTYGEHARRALGDCLPRVLHAMPTLHARCLGRGGREFVEALLRDHPDLAGRLVASGPLPSHDLATQLRACDVVVQPYVDGVSSRRTTIMAALVNGVPAVTTIGRLTEPIWISSGAVSLVPANDVAALVLAIQELLGDSERRREISERARGFYDEQFSIERTIRILLHPDATDADGDPHRKRAHPPSEIRMSSNVVTDALAAYHAGLPGSEQ